MTDEIGGMFLPLLHQLDDVSDQHRAKVTRTRYTEDRAPISDWVRSTVMARDKYQCVYCGRRTHLQMDHIVPWSAGGTDTVDNLRVLCGPCNERRSNRVSRGDFHRQLPLTNRCVRCDGGDELDDMVDVWCGGCGRRSRGYPRGGSDA